MIGHFCLIVGTIFCPVRARDIVFPPLTGAATGADSHYQSPLGASDMDADQNIVSGGAFAGLTTFANLPFVQCLSSGDHVEKYDIAFLGAPFDTVATRLMPNQAI